MDEVQFESLLDQVRELHRLTNELTRERTRFNSYVEARLRWDDRNAPTLPIGQRELADEVVDTLSKPRLSSSQSKELRRTFFGR
jgi:hypothetical protein